MTQKMGPKTVTRSCSQWSQCLSRAEEAWKMGKRKGDEEEDRKSKKRSSNADVEDEVSIPLFVSMFAMYHAQAHICKLTPHSHSLSRVLSLALSLLLSPSHTHSLTLSHMHAHTHKISHAHTTHPHTHAHICVPRCLSFSLSSPRPHILIRARI